MLKISRFVLLSFLIVYPIFQKVEADELKIGFVNMERVIRESPAAIMAGKRMEQKFEGRGLELQRIAEDIKSRQSALSENGSSLSDSQRRLKEAELSDISARFQRRQQEFQEDINAWQDEETSAILQKATKAIERIAKSEQLDMVLQEAVSVSNRLDITDKVIKALMAD